MKQIDLPKEFILSSKTKGFYRFYTPKIHEMLFRYEGVKQDIEENLAEFINEVFLRFNSYRNQWKIFINILAEIDCLISLNNVSFNFNPQ